MEERKAGIFKMVIIPKLAKYVCCYRIIIIIIIIIIITASGYVPGGSGTTIHNTIHKNTK
jgi:hypothetical protein